MSASSIALGENDNSVSGPFLRIPPFPGRKADQMVCALSRRPDTAEQSTDLIDRIRHLRVGGTYWASQPVLPPAYLLVRSNAALQACRKLERGTGTVLWSAYGAGPTPGAWTAITGDCDPWHMLGGATALVTQPGDELCAIAAILDVPTYTFEAASGRLELQAADARPLLQETLRQCYKNPFTGEPMSVHQAVDLCGFWRRLIDANREISGGIGFAFWKQDNVAPLLWSGTGPFRFWRNIPEDLDRRPIAIWRSKTSSRAISALAKRDVPLVEVEDGFLRSQGLGADCVPPLSIIVDKLGAYFDPGRPSELEHLLQDGQFDGHLIHRARRLRQMIVEAGLGKYERGETRLERAGGSRRHILVPGQVEDDRSVQSGGCGLVSNLELLTRVRRQAPDAWILYKPHPDVLAGHRRGEIADPVARQLADQVVSGLPISSLLAMVDEVHVNTSLAGFEALMRGKPVTTYGVPFYAGWGLTRDLGPVPSRRTAVRSLDELVAATLLLYPRYLDPVTGLPCPAEVAVGRLSGGTVPDDGIVVMMRRMQGKLMRRFRSLVQ
jgi:capsular polysaccharide export protein